jgi:hypothetical protein
MEFSTAMYADQVLDENGFLPSRNKDGDLMAEWLAIEEMIRVFSAEMRTKMFRHFVKGRQGWDNEKTHPNGSLELALRDATIKQDWVSVANYAMMLHNRELGD